MVTCVTNNADTPVEDAMQCCSGVMDDDNICRPCSSNNNCPETSPYCHHTDGYCLDYEPSGENEECSDDEGCDVNMGCYDGRCRVFECTDDGGCDSEHECIDNFCIPRGAPLCKEPGDACDTTDDCCDGFCGIMKKCRPQSYIWVYVGIGLGILLFLVIIIALIVVLVKKGTKKNSPAPVDTAQ